MSAKNIIKNIFEKIDDDQFEELLFTFLRHVNQEEKETDNLVRKRFVEFLAAIGKEKAERLIRLLATDEPEVEAITTSPVTSPTVGDVLSNYMVMKEISQNKLAQELSVDKKVVESLLIQNMRLTELNISDIATTVASQFKLPSPLKLRELLGRSYGYFCISLRSHRPLKMAARRKNI
jgi:hypothetical protein